MWPFHVRKDVDETYISFGNRDIPIVKFGALSPKNRVPQGEFWRFFWRLLWPIKYRKKFADLLHILVHSMLQFRADTSLIVFIPVHFNIICLQYFMIHIKVMFHWTSHAISYRKQTLHPRPSETMSHNKLTIYYYIQLIT